MIRAVLQWFSRLSRDCGALTFDGRELQVNDVTEEWYLVQDVYRKELPRKISLRDPKISQVRLNPIFAQQAPPHDA